ncbi:uncharacterized protein LOC143039040 [Oratosquilla oratoria]|uniref:uncharacterized protein LOC143039040 n=1 Tax=Oratosquilla oratoria TaxID=337810 RepID=UPI003F75E17C
MVTEMHRPLTAVTAVLHIILVSPAKDATGVMMETMARKNLPSLVAVRNDAEILMEVLAQHYTPECLWVKVQDYTSDLPQLNQEGEKVYRKPAIVLKSSGKDAEDAVNYINANTELVTTRACATYMAISYPTTQIIKSMTDLETKQMARHFIFWASDYNEAQKFLLDELFINEEHVAVIVPRLTSKNEIAIWDVYNRQLLTPSGIPEVRLVNHWKQSIGLYNIDELFFEQMGNFYGLEMKGVTLDFRPFTDYFKTPGSLVVNPKDSLDFYILDVIAKKLNFTYKLVMPEDGLWGVLDKGKWSGVVGDVQKRRANFSLVLSVTMERRLFVDFTRVYYIDPLSFVSAKSRPQPQWLKLITPFSGGVWATVLMTILGGFLLYYFLYRIQRFLDTITVTLSRVFMHVFGSFLGQSLFVIPWLTAAQMFLGFWLLYSFLITTYYKTSLTAALAVPSRPHTIDTLLQLLNSDLGYGMIDAKGSEYQLFSTSEVKLYKELFEKMTFYSSHESMRRVAEGKYAYIYFKSNLESLVTTQYTDKNGVTNLHIAQEEFFPGGYGWAFPKGAPYRRTFDAVMWRCVQAGLIRQWTKELQVIYRNEALEAKAKDGHQQTPASSENSGLVVLNLAHLQGPFLALLFGWGFGVLCLGTEIVSQRLDTQGRQSISVPDLYESSPTDVTFNLSLISSFLILSCLVIPKINLRALISAACICEDVPVVNVQVFEPLGCAMQSVRQISLAVYFVWRTTRTPWHGLTRGWVGYHVAGSVEPRSSLAIPWRELRGYKHPSPGASEYKRSTQLEFHVVSFK